MSDNENTVDIYNVWCEQIKKDLEKIEEEYNNMVVKFNSVIDRYSISTEYSKLVEINQTLGEISVLIYVGRQLFYNVGVEFIEYRKKFAEQVFKVLNVSAETINRVLNREEPTDSMYFFNEYNNLKRLVYEILDKRIAH